MSGNDIPVQGRIFPNVQHLHLMELIQMNIKRKIYSVILLPSLVLSAFPVGAVSYDGTWTQHKYNQGTAATPMRPFAGHFCYLSKVGMRDTDSSNEAATCRVRRRGSDWWLEAYLSRNDDADVFCSAICFNN